MPFDLEAEWPLSTVGDVADILDARRVPLNSEQRRKRQGSVPYWGANGIVDYIDDYLFDEPLVLMAEDGGYFDEAVSRPICHRLDGRVWVNNHAHIIRPRGVDRDFFYFWFVHRDITPFIKGGTRSKLNQAELKRLPIALPALDEQQRIAEVLRAADEAALQQAALLESLKAVSHHLSRAVLPDPEQAVPEGVSIHKLLDVSRPKQHPIISTKQLTPSGYVVFGANGQIGFADTYTHEQPVIAVTCRGATCGTVNWAPAKSYVSGNAMAIDELRRDLIDERYLFHYLQTWGVSKSISGSAQPQITRQSLACINVFVPVLPEQKRLSQALDETLAACQEQQSVLDGLVRTMATLSDDLLSGRVRVPA